MRNLIVAALALAAASAAQAASPDCEAMRAYSEARRGASLLVLKDGRPVCEAYGAGASATEALPLYSGTKSLVGLMAAAAVEDGLLTYDEPAAATLEEWRNDPIKAKATVGHLLSMSAGLPSRVGDVPTYAAALAMPFNAAPGARFQYGPAPMQAFGELMRRKLLAAGRPGDPLGYLKARIMTPAGARTAAWRAGADGLAMMPQGAAMTAREWARIGEFVRTGDGGKPLAARPAYVPLFAPSPANPAYGMTWWLPRRTTDASPVTASSDLHKAAATLPPDLVMAAGAGDQRLYVIPSLGLTIVRQARLRLADLAPRAAGAPTWSDAEFLAMALGSPR